MHVHDGPLLRQIGAWATGDGWPYFAAVAAIVTLLVYAVVAYAILQWSMQHQIAARLARLDRRAERHRQVTADLDANVDRMMKGSGY